MKFTSIACVLTLSLAILSGCSVATGTSGTTSEGRPVVVELDSDALKGVTHVTLTSPGEWECVGQYDHDPAYGRTVSTVTFPLTCSGGMTGTGIFAIGVHLSGLSLAFKLSSGESGNIKF